MTGKKYNICLSMVFVIIFSRYLIHHSFTIILQYLPTLSLLSSSPLSSLSPPSHTLYNCPVPSVSQFYSYPRLGSKSSAWTCISYENHIETLNAAIRNSCIEKSSNRDKCESTTFSQYQFGLLPHGRGETRLMDKELRALLPTRSRTKEPEPGEV